MTRHAAHESEAFASLVPPVWRASTVVFDSLEDFVARKNRLPDGFTYGTTGTPTQRALEARIAALDRGAHCVVLPSGQAAICNALLAFLRQGDHLLMTDAAYAPAKTFAGQRLAALGIEVEFYPPRVGADIEALMRPNTRLVWMESPGSLTMEVQDVPAIVEVAQRRGVLTALDNTWSGPHGFSPLDLGVDLCVHACTKYMGGHSDVLMGSLSTRDAKLYASLRALQAGMGQAVSAEDCFLVARGLETLEVRLERQFRSAELIARHLAGHRLVRRTLYPPLPFDRDHALWRRDHRGAGALFSIELVPAPRAAYAAMFEALRLISIGASWGGVHSVAGFYPPEEFAARRHCDVQGPLVRLSVGLEPVQALIAEMDRALSAFERHLNR